MALLDILASFNLVLVIYSLAKGNQWVLGFEVCQIQGSITITVITASLFNILAISVNRYIKICRINRLHWMNSQRNIKITVILVWILPISFSSVNMIVGDWYIWSNNRNLFCTNRRKTQIYADCSNNYLSMHHRWIVFQLLQKLQEAMGIISKIKSPSQHSSFKSRNKSEKESKVL